MNVLILTIKFGMGHFSASQSLRDQIKREYPNDTIHIQDICEYMIPKYFNTIYNAYGLFVNKGSKIYNYLYKHSEKNETDFRALIPDNFIEKLEKLIKEIQPDILISTCSICSQFISLYKQTTKDDIPFITCITDITDHPSWINPYTDYYLVASTSIKESLIKKGINKEQICIYGIPVKDEFIKHRTKHISPQKQLLIMGGGLGLLPKKESFYYELNRMRNTKSTIIVGNNEKLFEKLHGKFENITVLPYTEHVAYYMKNSDAIITKPGGLSIFEAIIAQVPILLFSPSLEQEVKNCDFILHSKIGEVFQIDSDCINRIEDFINDEDKLTMYRTNMEKLKNEIDITHFTSILHTIEEQKRAVNE